MKRGCLGNAPEINAQNFPTFIPLKHLDEYHLALVLLISLIQSKNFCIDFFSLRRLLHKDDTGMEISQMTALVANTNTNNPPRFSTVSLPPLFLLSFTLFLPWPCICRTVPLANLLERPVTCLLSKISNSSGSNEVSEINHGAISVCIQMRTQSISCTLRSHSNLCKVDVKYDHSY